MRMVACALALTLLAGCTLPVAPWRDLSKERAEAAHAARDYAMAQRFYEERVRDRPDDMLAHYRLAEIYEAVGRPLDAERHYRVIYVAATPEPLPVPGGGKGEPMGEAAWKQIKRLRMGGAAPSL